MVFDVKNWIFLSLLGAADIALHDIYERAEAICLDVAMNTALEENLFLMWKTHICH